MADNTWIYDIGSNTFAKMKYSVEKKLSEKYANLNFTKSNRNSITQFPTVYFHEMEGNELSSDLEGTKINAVKSNIQIEVYSDKSQAVCTEVAKAVTNAMADMKYRTIIPYFDNESTTFKMILRFNRTFGSDDKY